MTKLLVGTAGVPSSSKDRSSVNGIARIKELGLDAMEIEFVRGCNMNENTAKAVDAAAKEAGIVLTVHAPYYINLNSKDPEKREASKQRILKSASIGAIFNGRSVAFHPASLQGMPENAVFKIVKSELKDILAKAPKGISISPETAGKKGNFGSWKDIIDLASELKCGACMDFAHIWTRAEGKVDFDEVIEYYIKNLGKSNMYMHMSGINYTSKGERNHVMLADSEFPYKDILKVLVKHGCSGVIICESPVQEVDALKIKRYLESL